MSDNDGGGVTSRVAPKRGKATLADLTLLVRPGGASRGHKGLR